MGGGHPDIGEVIAATLGPSRVDLGSLGVQMRRSDQRPLVAAALGKVSPRAAADLMLARYADDAYARHATERAMLVEMSAWTRRPPRPGVLTALCKAAIAEHIEPPTCPVCSTRGWVWAQTDTGRAMCPACLGSGRQTVDMSALVRPESWDEWDWVYARLRGNLKRWEREARNVVRAQLGWVVDEAA